MIISLLIGITNFKINIPKFKSLLLVDVNGYIASGLKIKYNIDIFGSLVKVIVKYSIQLHLYLKVISRNPYQGLDLLNQYVYNQFYIK